MSSLEPDITMSDTGMLATFVQDWDRLSQSGHWWFGRTPLCPGQVKAAHKAGIHQAAVESVR